MTEFERCWAGLLADPVHGSETVKKELAALIWDRAQRACLRVIQSPPVIPSVGDKIIFRSHAHPIGKKVISEVLRITPDMLPCMTIEVSCPDPDIPGERIYTSGTLGEITIVERAKEKTVESPA